MRIILKPGREKSLLRRHPWIFSGAVKSIDAESKSSKDKDIPLGSTIDVLSSNRSFLAKAAYSPFSQIRARVWTFEDRIVDKEYFRQKIRAALEMRKQLNVESETNAYRLIFSESDSLPGFVVDKYGDVLVFQSLTAGSEYWKETFADLLLEETGLACIFERSDADVRELEGLQAKTGFLRNCHPLDSFQIMEHGLLFKVNIASGHKTGFYLDQRANRLFVRKLSKDKDILDCFCYSGGFTTNALKGDAKSVLSIDSSKDALSILEQNIALNHLDSSRYASLEGDVFKLLRAFRDESRSFDMIILDPPKFAPTSATAEKAARGYKDINLLAFKLLRPKGLLVTFSCSGGVDASLFTKIVASAALDAGTDAKIVQHLTQAPDHAVSLNFPEGAYLKGLVCVKG